MSTHNPIPGWDFASVRHESTGINLLRSIGIVYAIEHPHDILHAVGSCFVVFRQADFALCITAAHVIEQAVALAAPLHLKRRPYEDWPEDARRAVANSIRVYFGHMPYGIQLPVVESYHFCRELDLGTLGLSMPAQLANTDALPVLSLDSDFLQAQTRVAISAPARTRPVEIESDALDATYTIDPEIQIRAGVLRTGAVSREWFVRAHLYETSIATLPGMSGGPVFLISENQGDVARVIGVVSSDRTPPDQWNTPGHEAASYVVPIAYSYALTVGASTGGGPNTGFDEFCRHGAVHDFGAQRGRINVVRTPNGYTITVPL